MRKAVNIFIVIGLCASCRSTKPISAVEHPKRSESPDPKFLDNITISHSNTPKASVHKPAVIGGDRNAPGAPVYNIERCSALQFKYGILLDEEVERVTNERLISFLEEWYGIPYKYGGEGKKGIDCSAFSCTFMDSVYAIDIPRTCREQYSNGMKIRKDQLEQGDLVFFNTTGGISHVGIYLGNNKFVHASTSSGVMISDLAELYFQKRYVGSVRVR